MNNKSRVLIVSIMVLCSTLVAVMAIHAQQAAGVHMAQPGIDVASGKPLVLEVKLDKAAPAGSTVLVRVSPEGASQQTIQLQSSTPDDPSRKQFTLKTDMPPSVVVGKWTLQNVFVTIPGSIDWKTLEHNQLTFEVKGTPLEVPSSAEVTVAH